jgi:hypothetical protein
MGNSLAVLDWDGDGAPDVVVGAPAFYNPPSLATVRGRVRVVRGWDGTTLAEMLVPTALQNLAIGGSVGEFGAGLGVGGDLTGDGLGDLLVCVPTLWPTTLGFNAGAVAVVEAGTGAVGTTVLGSVASESPGCMTTTPEVGGTLVLPGTGPGSLGKIVFGSPFRNVFAPSGSLQAQWAGSLKVYDAGGGSPLLEVLGTANYEHRGWQVVGGRDLTGDGYPDFVVVRWPIMQIAPWIICCPLPRMEVYSGATLQLLYTQLLLAGLGQWHVQRVDVIPDVSGDGLSDILASMGGIGTLPVVSQTRIKLYAGATGAELGSWLLTDAQYGMGYVGYEARAGGDANNDGWGDLGVLHVVGLGGAQLVTSALQVFGRRNLTVSGSLIPGGDATMTIDTPKHGGRPYLLLFSGAPGPPVTVGPYVIPLAGDALFLASLNLALIGALDPAGHGTVVIPIPSDPSLSGATVYTSGVVVDPGSGYGVGTVLTRATVTIL